MLLERDDAIDSLRSAFEQVGRTGSGQFVIVGGEAGVGKTSVVRHAVDQFGSGATVLWGACDSLSTARALGPLADIATQVGGEFAELVDSRASRAAIFDATLRMLSSTQTTIVAVIEDVHWADEATIDLLTFLRRRIVTASALLLVTYRDDEITPTHPLRFLLGDAKGSNETRLHLHPLSRDAVATLTAGHELDAGLAHRITGGNPFFITELLAAGGATAPPTVRDAVLARASRLPPDARRVLDAIAIVPARTEMWLIDRLVDDQEQMRAVDDCVDRGVLRSDGDGVTFRHELARLAVRDAVAPVRRRELHRRALTALSSPPSGSVDEARVAHHAFEAGDVDAVLRHAPLAAEHAARVGAHRQAAEHLDHALRYAARLPVSEQIILWHRLAIERSALAEMNEALAALEAGIAACRSFGDQLHEGELLSRMGAVLTSAGRQREARPQVVKALALLEPLGATAELAYALLSTCAQHMLAREFADAERWGQKAIELATQLGRRDLLCQSLIQSGTALMMSGDDAGHQRILRGMDIAREEDLDTAVALGYSQIGSGGGEVRRYDLALPALEAGLAYCVDHELTAQAAYTRAWLARCHLDQGRWHIANDMCVELLGNPRCLGIARMVALTVLGRLRARRGDPGVWEALDESLDLARQNGHLQRLWPSAVARGEAAWLAGHLDSEMSVIEEAYQLAATVDYAWPIGELGYWLTRGGRPSLEPYPAAEPFQLALDGHLADAAAAWEALGCSFDAAVALVDSDDEALVRSALSTFERLGSPPAAKLAANRLRELGARVPRGPNAATRGNPAGVTGREIEVLALLVEGLRNSEIATRLVISAKTVDHHVSSLLAKLGVSSRQAAAAKAQRLGLVPDVGNALPKDGELTR